VQAALAVRIAPRIAASQWSVQLKGDIAELG
jgi:hypothetical protein